MRGWPLVATFTIRSVWAPAVAHSNVEASTRSSAVDDRVLTVALSTPSRNTLAAPCDESSSVTHAIARHEAQWNVADAEAAVADFAVPSHAPVEPVLCHIPAYEAAPSW